MNIHDLARPMLRHFRTRRMQRFVELFGITRETQVLDVGGSSFNWREAGVGVRPRLTFLNIAEEYVGQTEPGDRIVVADGCAMPFRSGSFDVVFCNSVIEHLSSRDRQAQLAAEIERVGKRYFVQTPNFWFPIEPHYLAPFVHYTPIGLRPYVGKYLTPWGWLERPSLATARAFVREIRLLAKRDFQQMFARGEVMAERTAGLVKSWIAIRR